LICSATIWMRERGNQGEICDRDAGMMFGVIVAGKG
jgi:hypothetical protein